MNPETRIQNTALLAVGADPDVLALRLQSGQFRAMEDPQRIVKVGVPGLADTMVFVRTVVTPEMVGKTIMLPAAGEVKTPNGRQSESQVNFQKSWEARGGVYRLIRCAADMINLVHDVKTGKAFR